ncbi:Asp23/Gls24 family envelope stress response protein [Streptomyces antimycoticus]|uniref:Asp23/Gls24 family envelope stress response protein n=1 Tax=Streptomyces antimycoticus TaxID=68175 RepID=UPI00256FE81D|nr:Asp23/Gls24 family envelope stress response protein [Streptomyces antimycoticus]WJD98268.1 Asp23/Gls24 family envelope stress response protein [Streptomyces antimycoticus]
MVARIAARAAHEALTRQGGEPPQRLGLSTPRTTATVNNGSVRLDVSLELPYPVDIARAGGEIRHYIAERVSHLTGLRIDGITVSVQRLVAGRNLRRGQVE